MRAGRSGARCGSVKARARMPGTSMGRGHGGAGVGAVRRDELWRRGGDVGAGGIGHGTTRRLDYMVAPDGLEKETTKSPKTVRHLLIERSGGNDRTLPPRVRSTLERSKTPGVATRRVRSLLIGRSQSPVYSIFIFFA